MGLLDAAPRHQLIGAAQTAKDIVADDAEMLTLAPDLSFHGIEDKRGGLLDAGDGPDAVVVKLRHGGLFIEGAAAMTLHHPKIRIGCLDDRKPFVDVAAVEAVHGQNNGKEQAHANYGGDEPAFVQL